jgi:replicative DNA helicase
VQWADGLPFVPQNQAALMSDFLQNPASVIAALAAEAIAPEHNGKTVPHQPALSDTSKIFESFHPDEHPACIRYLLAHGAPTDEDYNQTSITLARYALSRKLDDDAALVLAKSMAKATPDSHPTSKDLSGKLANFRSAWNSAKRHPEKYQWGCSYIWGSDELNRAGACIGKKCPVHPGSSTQSQTTKKPLNRLIWTALQVLSERGAEIRASLILAELENLKVDQPNWEATAASEAAEREALTFVLNSPEAGLAYAAQLDIPSVGFISTTALDARGYLQALEREKPCNPQTFQRHLERIRDTGLRVAATLSAQQSTKDLSDRTQPVPETLDRLLTESQKLLRRTSSEVQPMSAYTRELMGDLFSRPEAAIATPSGWLNNTLNGGFAPGRLYVIGAPPGAGKTTFCGWCGDFAAAAGLPVLYTAFEMSKIQLWIYSLSRLSGINSALIESKRWNDETYQPRESLFSRVTEAARNYHTQIAPRLTILEAGPEHTPARLKGAIAQVRHSEGLDESEPVLVIVDYLQLMLSGDEKLDTAATETLRVSRIATSLKQLARDTNTAFIAISDITKAAYQEALRTGSLDMSALRDSFKIAHAADVIALLQTGKITVGKGDNAQQQDQLQLAAIKYPEKARLIEQARLKHPLNQSSKDTYTRLSILKNRGGMLADPLFVYKKALHSFKPIDLDLGETSDDEAI